MAKTFRAWELDRVWMLPPTVRELVPDGHVAHFVRDTVREDLDLSSILGSYREERGHPPYHAAMMTALLLYAYRSRYRLRKHTAEPVIGNLKDRNGLRQFVLRGFEKVAGEWSLACTAHNLLKLAAARA